jgi:hypothetical protein
MIDCKNLVHPFQHDPGISQSQRVMDELLSDATKIDGRTLTDLLNYFADIAPHINYYNSDLQISDWKPFFKQSFPFLLASISKYDGENINEKFNHYTFLFRKKPTKSGLQLNISYVYYNLVQKINNWYLQFTDSEFPIVTTLQQTIKNRLQQPLKQFIRVVNAAVKWYCIKPVNFNDLLTNELWGLEMTDLYCIDNRFKAAGKSNRKRLAALQNEVANLFPAFIEAVKTLSAQAQLDLPQSFIPADTDLQKKNAPHLALVFCFLKIFQQQQGDLNGFTRKHLDFFYKDVLRIKPQIAVPDKANVVIQLQNQVKKFLLAKNILVKDSKDINNVDIEFALDDDIVVNETQVADIRTLFLNNEVANEENYVEGIYMAPKATKADGIAADFTDDQPKNYPTLGDKYSKYTAALKASAQAYPGARVGFILASNVLLLDKAERTIEIDFDCGLKDPAEPVKIIAKKSKAIFRKSKRSSVTEDYPPFIPSKDLYGKVNDILNMTYVYITEDLIQQAVIKGIDDKTASALREQLADQCKQSRCDKHKTYYTDEATVMMSTWVGKFTQKETDVLTEIFPLRRAFKISFSGEKDWISPVIENILAIKLEQKKDKEYKITIKVKLTADQDAVSFYNKDALKEDFGTTLPIVKVELDDNLKMSLEDILNDPANQQLKNKANNCCLDRKYDLRCRKISLYHFFRNLTINETKIRVTVCGLKNFIVQHNDIVQDVNSPIYLFGPSPKVNANFFIGSEEIFLKHWTNIHINMNWTDKPDFSKYYLAYQEFLTEREKNIKITNDLYKIDIAVLQDGAWQHWLNCRKKEGSREHYDCKTDDNSCNLFQQYRKSFCTKEDFTDQFIIEREKDFGNNLDSPKEEIRFEGYKKLDTTVRHSFIRITLKCGDFFHDLYPFVLAEYMIAAAAFTVKRQSQVNLWSKITTEPNKPWTPIINGINIDYKASANSDDINLIHLYPYSGTYKPVEIKLRPVIVPSFYDEGNLFLGLQNLVPGSNVNILFQLAEATSNSESNPQTVYWQYLANNEWMDLRPGFEIIDDATEYLTRSGIIKFSFPKNMTSDNTVMPTGMHWIKASVPQNSTAVSETIGIYAQAISATFTNDATNDKLRLSTPLAAGSISKLSTPDANIKQITQPGASFGGQATEDQGAAYYLRVSEWLRHKGRAIQKFDYERLALQQFPQLFKVKCINHSFALNANDYMNDFPIAPGYVLLAVIPDLRQLQAGNSFEPKVPVSMLEDIETKMQARTSSFVRFRAMNPRYEKIDFCITVQLMPDRDETYFREQLKEDIREFLAPWAVGKYDKLTFGQCVNRSDIINFIETLEYVDYIVSMDMFSEFEAIGQPGLAEVCPVTPRSILIAGDIDVTIQQIDCEAWSAIGGCDHPKILTNNYCKEDKNID